MYHIYIYIYIVHMWMELIVNLPSHLRCLQHILVTPTLWLPILPWSNYGPPMLLGLPRKYYLVHISVTEKPKFAVHCKNCRHTFCCVYCQLESTAHRADFSFAPSQWETPLQSNAVSHWLGAKFSISLVFIPHITIGIKMTCLWIFTSIYIHQMLGNQIACIVLV